MFLVMSTGVEVTVNYVTFSKNIVNRTIEKNLSLQ